MQNLNFKIKIHVHFEFSKVQCIIMLMVVTCIAIQGLLAQTLTESQFVSHQVRTWRLLSRQESVS